ncbi:hypothetical protein UCREL1_5603 [Eutypa lata UCREL1]|uniref:Uncharacterized protein n=1 Tax=Eutypa lata (strain UCR-EL1) TaxID=1287681 RepID=M7SLW9_EUTLA|nr:hypothetical protein UCREL1_5603 [Eutypa lata UCREL1]
MPVTAETEFRDGEAELLSWTGTSSPVSGCSLTDSATYTHGTSQSASVDCPEGGIKCGLMVIPSLCKVTGEAEPTRDEPLGAQNCSDMPVKSTYEVESICMRGDSKNNDMNAITDFQARLLKCNEDKCDKNKASQMKPCPRRRASVRHSVLRKFTEPFKWYFRCGYDRSLAMLT